jgi:putative sterol carrier protein
VEAHRRPPPEITPEDFFESWLPSELERLGSAAAPQLLVRVALSGAGGGSWDLQMADGKLETTAGGTGKPLVTLMLTVQDWRAIIVGEEGPVDLAPPKASPTDLLFVDAAAQQLLAAISGTYRFEVTDFNGRTWILTALFNEDKPADPPTATITTDAETYAAILARELAAPEAYFQQKIKITGDAGRGMQVGLALLPKF